MKPFLLFFIIFIYSFSFCQIKTTFINLPEDVSFENEDQINLRKSLETDSSFIHIKESFKTFNFSKIKKYFSQALLADSVSIYKTFDNYTKLFNKSKSIGFYDDLVYDMNITEITGFSEFSSDDISLGMLRVQYSYELNFGKPHIYKIIIIQYDNNYNEKSRKVYPF